MHTNYTLIHWDERNQKWADSTNDYFCSKSEFSGTWEVRARYGFPNGERVFAFPNEGEAIVFFVNFLHSRVMDLTVEGYAIRERMQTAAAS